MFPRILHRFRVLALLPMAALCVPAFGVSLATPGSATPGSARPGTVNYIEGSANLAGTPLTSKSVGSAELNPGEVLSTGEGKAEILMTPGVYLRLDDHSSVKMISPDLTFTQFALERGRAAVEVDEIHPQNNLQIAMSGIPTQMLKTGLYEFNAGDDVARVFKGKAAARMPDGKWIVIKGGRELALTAGDNTKPQKFNTRDAEDEFYNWSSLRSQYLSEASARLAQNYTSGMAPGWYWDPYFFGYTFMGPYPFYSPFGWGFYPFGYRGPIIYGRRGFYGNGFHGHPRIGQRLPATHGHGSPQGQGFHGQGFQGSVGHGAGPRGGGFQGGHFEGGHFQGGHFQGGQIRGGHFHAGGK